MGHIDFDVSVLRSLVAGIDLGSFAKASDRVGRSTSAISAQIRRLEEQAGTPLFRKSGRGLMLTEAGETMLAYARRMIELNDEAAVAVRGVDLEGWIRLGMQEDFGEAILLDVLGRFARAHPKVRIEARVARNAELSERIASNQLDLALVWGDEALRAHQSAWFFEQTDRGAADVVDRFISSAVESGGGRAVATRRLRPAVSISERGHRGARPGGNPVAGGVHQSELVGIVGGGCGRTRPYGSNALRVAGHRPAIRGQRGRPA